MKRKCLFTLAVVSVITIIIACNENAKDTDTPDNKSNYGGYATQQEWGEHLVTIGSCSDCHTPKKMTPQGPDIDTSLLFSGHPAQLPDPDVNRQDAEAKGLVVTNDLTAWVGPWGISYTANLTPDASGIGSWQESQFIYAIREGKAKGLPNSRSLLPPMPWQMYRHMTDDELKAIFSYLKSIKPIKNVVPPPKPPVSAAPK